MIALHFCIVYNSEFSKSLLISSRSEQTEWYDILCFYHQANVDLAC